MQDAIQAVQAVGSTGGIKRDMAMNGAGGLQMRSDVAPDLQSQQQAQRQFELAMSRAENAQSTSSPNTAVQSMDTTARLNDSTQSNRSMPTQYSGYVSQAFAPVTSASHTFSRFSNGLHNRFVDLNKEVAALGDGFDITKPSSAVTILERQMRITNSTLEFQMVLQSAENVKHGIKSLTQMQG